MATRSTIAIQREDGTVAQVYAHWDGYLEGNGAILVNNYNTTDKVEELIGLGDISSLGDVVGEKHPFSQFEPNLTPEDHAALVDADAQCWTTFYGRDRGEKDTAARVFENVEAYEKKGDSGMFEEFNYLFIDNRWYYKSYDGQVRDVEKQLVWQSLNKQEAV